MAELTVPVAYVAGVSIALCSTLISATGLTLQKRTHKRLEQEKTAEAAALADGSITQPMPRKPYYRQWSWLAGIACLLISAICSLGVFALLGQARASSLAAMTIVWNGLLSRAFLGEVFTSVDAISSVLVILGALIALIFGANGAAEVTGKTIDELVHSLRRTVVVVAAIILTCLYCIAYWYNRSMNKRAAEGTRTESQKRAQCYVRVALAALFSGSTGMLSKDVVICLVQMVQTRSAYVLTRFECYLFLACLPLSLVLQLGYLNSALRELDALEVVPPYQVGIVLVGIAWGYIFSAEGAAMSYYAVALFLVGAAISCVGVILLLLKSRLLTRMRRLRQAMHGGKVAASSSSTSLAATAEEPAGGLSVQEIPAASKGASADEQPLPTPSEGALLGLTWTAPILRRGRTRSGSAHATVGEPPMPGSASAMDLTIRLAGADTLGLPAPSPSQQATRAQSQRSGGAAESAAPEENLSLPQPRSDSLPISAAPLLALTPAAVDVTVVRGGKGRRSLVVSRPATSTLRRSAAIEPAAASSVERRLSRNTVSLLSPPGSVADSIGSNASQGASAGGSSGAALTSADGAGSGLSAIIGRGRANTLNIAREVSRRLRAASEITAEGVIDTVTQSVGALAFTAMPSIHVMSAEEEQEDLEGADFGVDIDEGPGAASR